MYKRVSPEDRLNAARAREQIDLALRKNYQACMTDELPPRLLAALKKLDEERPELSSDHVQVIRDQN